MKTKLRVALLSTLTLILAVAPADAALDAFLNLTDEPGGTPIDGGSSQAGHAGQVEVYEFHHLMEVPGGMTVVDHQTVIVTVPLNDKSIPILLDRMDNNGAIGVVLHLLESDGGGAEVGYMDITLTGAKVVSFEPLSPNNQIPELSLLPATARIRFSYATIKVDNLSAADYTLTNPGN